MKAFKLDENGDLVRENGTFVRIEGDEELAQQIRMAIQTDKGEWFLDEEEGMDREPLFAKVFNEEEAKDSIMESVVDISEPVIFEEIIFKRDTKNRVMTVDLLIRKEDGETFPVEGVEI